MVDEGVVELAADPPAQLALELALDAAQSVAQGARPGSHLLAWIGEWSDIPLRWSPGVTKQLFAVLTDGDVRAWRFLETTGVLERALPELAEAVDRRRNDPFLLDPSHVLRFRSSNGFGRSAPPIRLRPRSTPSSSTPSGSCSGH